MSAYHFHRWFKQRVGLTPRGYAVAQRSLRLRNQLRSSKSVTEAVHAVGFNASSRFYAQARADLGMAPRQFRDGGAGVDIAYTLAKSPLGWVLVAATDVGVCSIEFGDRAASLVDELRVRFPKATLQRDDDRLRPWVDKVLSHLARPAQALKLPTDLRGTVFQQLVWRALREIPPGKTRSYTDIARQIGKPRAVRAVASAIASNTLALAIPCHRVVRQDGDLADYRWGRERKRALIDAEARVAKIPNRPPTLP